MSDDPQNNAAAPRQESGDEPTLESRIVAAMKECYDPEIPVNIYDLGLIYRVDVDDDARVEVQMTLTSPACPVAGSLPGEVAARVRAVSGVSDVDVELVWDPPWNQDMMSEAAQVQLGFF